jgi:O-antigen/teichoic acid export membrane protein
VIHLSAVLILYSDSVVIGALISVEVVTMFAIAANLTEYARSLLLSFTQTLTPMASAMVGAGDSERLQHLLLRSMRLSLVIMLPVLITFELRGQTFVGIWMGSEYAASSGRVLQILAIGQLFGASYQVLTAIILGLNRHRLMVPIFLVEAATNLVLSITLTGRFGIIGVAIGTAAPRLMVALFVAPILARRMFGISPHPFVREAWLKPLAGAIPFAIASYAVERWWPTDNLFFFFFQVACMLPVAWLGSWFVAVEPSERAQVSQLLRRHLLRTA